MRLEWLEDILAVAETGSFLEAAERRRLTPSAFSRRIQTIEEHVGIELFDRSHKPVQLRPALSEQRDRITELAGSLRQLGEDLRRDGRVAVNRVVVASQHALTTAFAPGLVRRVEMRRPEIQVRLRSANLDACHGLLFSRQADIALVYRLDHDVAAALPDYVEVAVIGADALIPVAAPGTVPAEDAALPLVAYPREVFLGRVLERHLLPPLRERRGVVAKVETALTLAALELAAEGIGVAWVPRSLARRQIGAGRVADLSGRLPSCRLAVAALRLRGAQSPAAAALWADLAAPPEDGEARPAP